MFYNILGVIVITTIIGSILFAVGFVALIAGKISPVLSVAIILTTMGWIVYKAQSYIKR